MADKNLILTDAGAARYRTRMLTAGDPVTLPGPKARLFRALGWAEEGTATPPAPTTDKPQLDHDGDGKADTALTPEQRSAQKGLAEAAIKAYCPPAG